MPTSPFEKTLSPELPGLEEVFSDPIEAIQNVIEKGHSILATNKEWLMANFPPRPDAVPSNINIQPGGTASTAALPNITAPPNFHDRKRAPQAPANCNAQVTAAQSEASRELTQRLSDLSKQLGGQVSQADTAAASASSAAASAKSAANAISMSAAMAVSAASSSIAIANSSVAAAVSSVAAISSSASAAVLAAQSSLTSAQLLASSSISLALLSAQSSITLAQASASAAISSGSASVLLAISSASQSAALANSKASLAISQAEATNSANANQAAASVRQSQVQAITATQAAIAIVVAIVGTALLFVISFLAFARYRRNQERKRKGSRNGRKTPEISKPFPIQEKDGSMTDFGSALDAFPIPPLTPKTPRAGAAGGGERGWSFSSKDGGGRRPGTGGGDSVGRKSTSSRKTMLIYDPENPDRPPMVGVVTIEDEVGRRESVVPVPAVERKGMVEGGGGGIGSAL